MSFPRQTGTYHHENFTTEAETTFDIDLYYVTLGTLNESKSNAIWVLHALTGNADVLSWCALFRTPLSHTLFHAHSHTRSQRWRDLFADPKAAEQVFDPKKYFIVCANCLGGCYGSTGPLSIDPLTRKPYYHSFPLLTTRDCARAFDLLRIHLGLASVHILLAPSMGAQQGLEWACLQPAVFKNLILITGNAKNSPWAIAFNETQRMAIEADSTWRSESVDAGKEGLKAARAMAILSYRCYEGYHRAQPESDDGKREGFKAASYQRYQGEKLTRRFNAYTYVGFSRMMDSHNIARGRNVSAEEVLKTIQANTCIISVDTDILFPPQVSSLLLLLLLLLHSSLDTWLAAHAGAKIHGDAHPKLEDVQHLLPLRARRVPGRVRPAQALLPAVSQ